MEAEGVVYGIRRSGLWKQMEWFMEDKRVVYGKWSGLWKQKEWSTNMMVTDGSGLRNGFEGCRPVVLTSRWV